MQLPFWESGCYCPHFADEGTEAQRVRQVPKITDLARGPKFLSPNPMLLHVTKACALFHPADLYYQGTVCLHHQEGLLDGSGIGKTEWSLPLWFTNSYLKSLLQAKIVSIPAAPAIWIACSPEQVSLRQEGLQYTWCWKE